MNIIQVIRNIPDIIFAYRVCKKKGLKMRLTTGRNNCGIYCTLRLIEMDVDYPCFKTVFLHEYGHWVDHKIKSKMSLQRSIDKIYKVSSVMGENRNVRIGDHNLYDCLNSERTASVYALRFLKHKGCLKHSDVSNLYSAYMTYQGKMRNMDCAPTLGVVIPHFDVKVNALRGFYNYAK